MAWLLHFFNKPTTKQRKDCQPCQRVQCFYWIWWASSSSQINNFKDGIAGGSRFNKDSRTAVNLIHDEDQNSGGTIRVLAFLQRCPTLDIPPLPKLQLVQGDLIATCVAVYDNGFMIWCNAKRNVKFGLHPKGLNISFVKLAYT